MGNRPLGVTLVAIVAWVSGFLQALGAIFAILGGLLITWHAILGWFSLLIGVVTLAVGVGLWRGNPTARTIAVIVFWVNIVIAALSVFGDQTLWSAFGSAFLSIVGLILLSTQNARRYFAA